MLPQTLPKGSPNLSKWVPGACPEQVHGKASNFVAKSLPNGVPGAPQRVPFWLHFRLIFCAVFKKAPRTLPDTLHTGLGTVLAPVWLHFWSCLGTFFRDPCKSVNRAPAAARAHFSGSWTLPDSHKTSTFLSTLSGKGLGALL